MSAFPDNGKEAPEDFQVRIGQEELGRIFHLRDSLEQSEALIQHADRYRELGWALEARGALFRDGLLREPPPLSLKKNRSQRHL